MELSIPKTKRVIYRYVCENCGESFTQGYAYACCHIHCPKCKKEEWL